VWTGTELLLRFARKKMERREQERKARMERLETDLRFFENELANERDQYMRNVLLGQIRDIKQEMLHLLREERADVERQNENLKEMLNLAKQLKKK
jgi:hypothetical protein